jgi:hypothetical protein
MANGAGSKDIRTPGLGGNPRRTKRFLNTLLLRLTLGQDRGLALQRQILAKLMLLEYLRPEFFKQLARLPGPQRRKITKKEFAKSPGITRSTLYYQPKLTEKDWNLKTQIEEVLHIHPAYGHKRLAIALAANRKRGPRPRSAKPLRKAAATTSLRLGRGSGL